MFSASLGHKVNCVDKRISRPKKFGNFSCDYKLALRMPYWEFKTLASCPKKKTLAPKFAWSLCVLPSSHQNMCKKVKANHSDFWKREQKIFFCKTQDKTNEDAYKYAQTYTQN